MNHIPKICGVAAIVCLALVLPPTPASAHTPSATPSCTGLAVSMANYSGPGTPTA